MVPVTGERLRQRRGPLSTGESENKAKSRYRGRGNEEAAERPEGTRIQQPFGGRRQAGKDGGAAPAEGAQVSEPREDQTKK